jgi:hypothetical protein
MNQCFKMPRFTVIVPDVAEDGNSKISIGFGRKGNIRIPDKILTQFK